jgi:hypothetical protein
MWDLIYGFIIKHQVLISAAVTFVLTLLLSGKLELLFRRFKKFKLGKLEIDTHDQEPINPSTPCPYADSKKRTMEAINKNAQQIAENTRSIEALGATSNEIMAELKIIIKEVGDLRIDQLKDAFWRGYPHKESLISGLKFVSKGGNSETKTKLIERIKGAEEEQDLYETVVLIQQNLRIAEVDEWIKAQK